MKKTNILVGLFFVFGILTLFNTNVANAKGKVSRMEAQQKCKHKGIAKGPALKKCIKKEMKK